MHISIIKNKNYNHIPKENQSNSVFCNISFRSNDSFESSSVNNTKLIHYTALFREPKTDEFVQKYIKDNFKNQEIKIVSAACSSGEEVFSYACMLNDIGKKIKITGFDISDNVLEMARTGIVDVKKYKSNFSGRLPANEGFLFDNKKETPYLEECKKNFFKYFIPQGKKEKVKLPDFLYKKEKRGYEKTEKLLTMLKMQGFSQLEEKIKNYYGSLTLEDTYEAQKYKFNYDLASNCSIDFRHGDILELNELFPKSEEIDVFLCKNALYHILCTEAANKRVLSAKAETIMNSIAKEMNRIVSKGGLVVFGEQEDSEGIDKNQIYRIMQKNGFIPIFLNKEDNHPDKVNIWKKVSV